LVNRDPLIYESWPYRINHPIFFTSSASGFFAAKVGIMVTWRVRFVKRWHIALLLSSLYVDTLGIRRQYARYYGSILTNYIKTYSLW